MQLNIKIIFLHKLYLKAYSLSVLSEFVKLKRKSVNLTQEEFADKCGVALTVIRKIEQGKTYLQMDKVNIVLAMLGHELCPVESKSLNS